jgi:hypothetical protein
LSGKTTRVRCRGSGKPQHLRRNEGYVDESLPSDEPRTEVKTGCMNNSPGSIHIKQDRKAPSVPTGGNPLYTIDSGCLMARSHTHTHTHTHDDRKWLTRRNGARLDSVPGGGSPNHANGPRKRPHFQVTKDSSKSLSTNLKYVPTEVIYKIAT